MNEQPPPGDVAADYLADSASDGIDAATGAVPPSRPFPWPPPPDGRILARFGETWRSAMFDPAGFFARLPRDRGTGAAVAYYLVVGVLVAGVNLFWAAVATNGGGEETLAAAEGLAGLHPLTRFLLSPATLLLGLAVAAAVTHVLLLMLGGARHGFGSTIRTFCYAYSPMAFAVVPVVGPLVGAAWMVALGIMGLREAHETAAWKTALAVLLPLTIFLVMLLMVAAAFVAVG